MQDLASEFSKISWWWYPRTLTAEGATPSHTNTHPAVETQILVPLNFSAPLAISIGPTRQYPGLAMANN